MNIMITRNSLSMQVLILRKKNDNAKVFLKKSLRKIILWIYIIHASLIINSKRIPVLRARPLL